MDAILERVLIGSLITVIGAFVTLVASQVPKLVRWAWRTLQTWRRSGVDVVTVPHHGSYNLDLVPRVAGPSRECNERWSDVLGCQKRPVRFRPIAQGSRGTYRGYHTERY